MKKLVARFGRDFSVLDTGPGFHIELAEEPATRERNRRYSYAVFGDCDSESANGDRADGGCSDEDPHNTNTCMLHGVTNLAFCEHKGA